jgi:hypothetical protein
LIALLVLLDGALLALGIALMVMQHKFEWLMMLLALPWAAGLVMLGAARALGVELLRASALLYGLVLLYPAFLSIAFLDGSLRSASGLLFLLDCILILAIASAQRRAAPPLPSAQALAAWGVPLLSMGLAYGLTQRHEREVSREVLKTMDLKTGDETKRLVDCLARFSAANTQHYPADTPALQQHCASELKLSYYRVEYVPSAGDAAGAADYSMCLLPIPGASPEPNPPAWILGPWGGLVIAYGHSGSPCGHPTGPDGIVVAAHQCLLRRQTSGGSYAVPNFRDIGPQGSGCLAVFDYGVIEGVKISDALLTESQSGRFLLLAPDQPADLWRPRFLHCDRSDAIAPRVWTSRSFFEPAPPELAKLCASG